ncbi:MAG: hypothetical protein ACJ0BT_03080 [Pseudohongiellaceae bacterium]
MKAKYLPLNIFLLLLLAGVGTSPIKSYSHGSITADGDLCVIQIGFYRAHFKIFQPATSGAQEFCEDIPDSGGSIFVMEYLHQELGNVPIDFRIIRNVTGLGLFARLQDMLDIKDIEAATVFYQEPVIESEVFTVIHEFQKSGDYMGIVTARHPETAQLYTAVFPFQVGYTGFGLLPLFIVLVILTQLVYWKSTGGFARFLDRNKNKISLREK